MQIGFENADDHRYLSSIAAKYGIYLSRAGNGICHQVHLERFGKPGTTLLGSDSHTPTGGALGMLAIGAGGLDVALAMAGKPFYMNCPKVIGIRLSGSLRPWSSAKDLALKMLEIFSTKGNVGCVFEYFGEGVATLSVPERSTITNMGAECGVTTSIFPSDDATAAYLATCGRSGDFARLGADADAEYDRIVDLDLGALEPLVALPHSPGNIATVRSRAGMKVDQVCVGSCTNSSYKDLATVAQILKGRVAHPGLSFVVTPGSRQVLRNIAADGYLETLVAAGARLVEPSCGFCIGNGHSPASGSVSLRTSNRNFESRSGTADAGVFLVSPETAAAAVISGMMSDPRDLGALPPPIAEPERFLVDDDMIIPPISEADAAAVEILRGPNIGEPPRAEAMPDSMELTVAIKTGDKITTDHIIPAGARMKFRSNIAAYSRYVFENLDPGFASRALSLREAGKKSAIAAGLSYGQGSSREHAAICPFHLGVRAVFALSFERIHAANLVNFGILPLVFASVADYAALSEGDALEISGIHALLEAGKPLLVLNRTKGNHFEANYDLSDRQKAIILAGGVLAKASAEPAPAAAVPAKASSEGGKA
jgi:aconitate hydratase